VTAVDSTEKLELLRSLGATHAIDYTLGDYTQKGETYDLIIDVVGGGSVARRLRLLKENGHYFLAYAGLSHILLGLWASLTGNKKLKIESSSQRKEDLIILKGLIEAGVLRVVIDKTYPLSKVAEAHRYVESGAKQGNVVITVGAETE
jgi:NADPH2:quinone reductase